MKKLAAALSFLALFSLPSFAQASFPRFGSIENDGITTINRFNLGWAKSITLVSVPSRGLTFNPRLTYNSFIWQKNGSVWSPVVGDDGNPTWGWVHNGMSFQDTNVTYQGYRYRCVADDGSNQWGFEYSGFQTTTQTFSLDLLFSQLPDQYPECGSPGQVQSDYGRDTSGAPTGYLLSVEGIGGGFLPHPTMTLFSPGGTNVDVSGSISDTNGNHIATNTNGNVETWTDTIGRAGLTITNDTANHLTTYAYSDSGGTSQSWTMHYTRSNIRTAFSCPNTSDYAQSGIYLPTSLVLPGTNGSYTFDYEATPDPNYPGWTTGRISKITLPTGGWIQYTYSGVNCDDGSPMQMTKTINDGSTSSVWTYTRTNNGGGSWTTAITTPSNSAVVTFNSDGVATDEKTYATTNQTALLREVQQTYQNHIPQQTTISSGTVSKVLTTSYDYYGNLTGLAEFDWNSTSTPVRTTTYTYMTDPSFLSNGLVNRLTNQTVRLGYSGAIQARTDYFYDFKDSTGNPDNDSGNIGMTCQSGAAGHDDTSYGCSGSLPRGNLTKVVQYSDPANGAGAIKTYYGYDSLGNIRQIKDPRGNSTTLSYADQWDGTSSCSVSSAFAYPTIVTDALGHQQTTWYNRCIGQVAKTQDPNIKQTTFAYNDVLLRQTNVSYPDWGGANYSYSTNQTIVQVVGGTSTATTIDGIGRTTHVQTADGTTDYSYGFDGQGGTTASVSNPYQGTPGPSTTTHSDALGRVTQVDYADATSHSYANYSNNCQSLTDAANHQRSLCFDGLGRMTQVYEDPSGSNIGTTYTYNALDQLTDILQNGSAARHFGYDGLSRMTSSNQPETGPTSYGYDNNGNLAWQTDNSGVTVSFTYDAVNRITDKLSSGTNLITGFHHTYGYDNATNGIGRLTWATNGINADELFAYDSMGRLNWQSSWTPSNPNHTGIITTAMYDVAGNMTDLTYPDGRHVTQTWNNGHLSGVKFADWNGSGVNYPYVSATSYLPDGSPQSMTFGNGVQVNYSENSRLQLSGLSAANALQPFNGQQFLSHAFCYTSSCNMGSGNNGNIVAIQNTLNSAKTQTFGYDALNRIASAQSNDNNISQTFNIDAWGNMKATGQPMTTNGLTFNGNNQISGFTYDGGGRLTATNVGGPSISYGYNADGKLISVNGVSGANYTFDAQDQRVRKDVSSDWTEYVYFNGMPISEKHADGTWSDYIYANGQRIARSESYDTRIHLKGTTQVSGYYAAWTMPSMNYLVQPGDRILWRQYQGGGAQGGLGIEFTDGSNANWGTTDTDGQVINSDTTQNSWHERAVNFLPSAVGKTINSIWLTADAHTPGGSTWDEYFNDIAIVSTNGAVTSIYHNAPSIGLSYWSNGNIANPQGFVETSTQYGEPLFPQYNTTYYLGDHLGTARMEFTAGGWPVWQGEFAPYGQEINVQGTPNQYKFTGFERDEQNGETGLDHATFRQYSSAMGRWYAPDPYLGSMDLTNPQSLNRYAYVGNRPVTSFDPTGLNEAAPCDWYCWIFDYGPYGSGGNPGYCSPQYAQCYEPSSGGGGSGGSSGDGGGGGGGGGTPWNDTYGVPYPGLGSAIGQALNLPPLGGGCEFGACDFVNGGRHNKGCNFIFGNCGFSFTDFFAWAGLYSLANNTVQVGKFHANAHQVTYEDWCGPGGSGPDLSGHDAACHVHDGCYDRNGLHVLDNFNPNLPGGRASALQGCNQQLCNATRGSLVDKYFSGPGSPFGGRCR